MNYTVKYHYSQCEDTKKAERITVLPLINGLLSCNSANHFIELCLSDAFNSQFDRLFILCRTRIRGIGDQIINSGRKRFCQ